MRTGLQIVQENARVRHAFVEAVAFVSTVVTNACRVTCCAAAASLQAQSNAIGNGRIDRVVMETADFLELLVFTILPQYHKFLEYRRGLCYGVSRGDRKYQTRSVRMFLKETDNAKKDGLPQ